MVATGNKKAEPRPDYLLIEHLVKRFDDAVAVDDVSLTIGQGEIFALLGSSGCGKSTLLRMLAGFETPTSGRILLGGQDIAGVPPYDRPVNMMFQSYALFPHLNIWDNIAFGLKREGMAKSDLRERVDEMLALVQLTPYAKRKPHQLSGGQQQRVALARSLAKRPKLLLLDEPLGALDKKLREQTQFELVNIIEKVGVTCVMVTHDQEEAMVMASRIGVMSQGRILQVGRPNELYDAPNSTFVADFIGNVNLFAGVVSSQTSQHILVDTPEGQQYVEVGACESQPGTRVRLAVRPEKIRIYDTNADPMHGKPIEPGFNMVRGRVQEKAYFGDMMLYYIKLPTGAMLKVTQPNAARRDMLNFEYDAEVQLWWHSEDTLVLAD